MAAALVCALALGTMLAQAATDPLPSWNDGKAKQSIMDFVTRVTTPGKDFVAEAERVATFDNDGTLWAEQPLYFQAIFIFDRIRTLAPELASRPSKSSVAASRRITSYVTASRCWCACRK
jgi:hypothetical protein